MALRLYARSFVFVALLMVALGSCAQEEYPASLWAAQHPAAADASVSIATGARICTQPRAQSLPQRLVAMSTTSAAPTGNTVLVSDLFNQFNQVCSPCHTAAADPPGQGGFQIVTATDFSTLMTSSVIQHVVNAVCPNPPDPASPNDPMPPCSSAAGATFASRSADNPIRVFAQTVQAWLAAGSPTSFTYVPPGEGSGEGGTGGGAASGSPSGDAATDGGGDAGVSANYALSVHDGNAMTNIGTCVPSAALVGMNTDTADALDAKFAALQAATSGTPAQIIGLPEHLSETDLYTLDSSVLAQDGTIPYAPGYPLWSDNAGKLRYVRVPRGTSIQFDKTTQQFRIPANTRFYKTFMKQIIDTDGSYRYRKIETRLIVSRPDQNNPDGTALKQTALFGSYQWNADESDAVLVENPLNDGNPFADTILLYHTNEPLAADLLAGQPVNPEAVLLEAGAARNYAIPSSQRCMQCHMGSPSQSFILGFTPLQINRFPTGTHGIIEEAGPDELTQLQRLIDAGVITGIDSPSDVLPLEQSQGTRTPRNSYEVVAQGYVLGNCAHCHNPRGYPTVQNPVLATVLDFLPTAGPLGGLFQFPLEAYSPRIARGVSGSTPIPYITPSLVDLPKTNPGSGQQAPDWFINPGGAGTNTAEWADYAPWRSIIYRNVDAAFAYTDDFALFPHMPMNTPGYDPRAKEILGDWMVSIPAVRKQPQIVEYAYQTDSSAADNIGSSIVDTSPQPYVEVLPGAPGYDAAVAAAEQRLSIFHSGANPAIPVAPGGTVYSRYNDPGVTTDIIDPQVTADPICHPIPVGNSELYDNPLPEHPHWVSTDLTVPPGPWYPRQPNWPDVLVEQQIPPATSGCTALAGEQAAYQDQVEAIGLLQSASYEQPTGIDDTPTLQDFLTTPRPMGLWQTQTGCNFSSVPTVSSFTGTQRPHWMDVANAADSAPVYLESPGAFVFKMICINCHGPDGAADGRLAQNLATMTGGNALVADFRDGLFGPVGAPEDMSNRHAVFGSEAGSELPSDAPSSWTQLTDDDRAARYMAWMGLGGTSVNIPLAVLQIVAITKVLDQERTLSPNSLSANMLSQAKALCLSLMGPSYVDSIRGAYFDPTPGHGYLDAKLTGLNDTLIPSNGDAELWLALCSMVNPPPVHILSFASLASTTLAVQPMQNSEDQTQIIAGALAAAADFPAGAPVGNQSGGVDPTLEPTNEWPWCVDSTQATSTQAQFLAANGIPTCPPSVVATSQACARGTAGTTCFGLDQANQWAVRGAINAGMGVFQYVESIENTGPAPDYDQCNLLAP